VDAESKFSPPYNIPWATFASQLERMAADPPGRVDRSYLDSQSGTVQTYLIAAFKGFGLIDADARPTSRVKEFADPESRKERVADLLQEFYPRVVNLGTTNATSGQLAETFTEEFPNITGESRVKAIRFFMSAMAYAELPTSKQWGSVKAPRGASGRKSTGAGRKPTRTNGGTGADPGADRQSRSAEHRSVTLPSGATLTLNCSIPLMTLPADELGEVLNLIKTFDALSGTHQGGPSS
jgi:hypothetical protein